MNVSRWDEVWIFLSLDVVEQFRRELLVPRDFGPIQKAAVRDCMSRMLLEKEPLDGGILSVFKAVDPDLAQKAENLYMWGEYIFLHQGSDRIAETIWRLSSQWLASHRISQADSWVYDFMDKLRLDQNSQSSALEQQLLKMHEIKSSWDNEWIQRKYGDAEPVFANIELISTYNFFLISWNKFRGEVPEEELQHLFSVAVEVARVNKFPHAVPYPDTWRLTTQRFLTET